MHETVRSDITDFKFFWIFRKRSWGWLMRWLQETSGILYVNLNSYSLANKAVSKFNQLITFTSNSIYHLNLIQKESKRNLFQVNLSSFIQNIPDFWFEISVVVSSGVFNRCRNLWSLKMKYPSKFILGVVPKSSFDYF